MAATINRFATALLMLFLLPDSLAAQSEYMVETNHYRLEFSPAGDLKTAEVCYPSCGQQDAKRQMFGGTEPLIAFESTPHGWQMSRGESDRITTIAFSRINEYREYVIDKNKYQLSLKIKSYDSGFSVRGGESLIPPPAPGFGRWLERLRYLWIDESEVTQADLDETDELPELSSEESLWFGFRSRFWALMMNTDAGSQVSYLQAAATPALDIKAGFPVEVVHSIYLGPIEPGMLEDVHQDLGGIMYAGLWFWLRWICIALFALLSWIQQLIPVWGWAVVFLSLAVKLLMYPLNRVAEKFQHQVNDTQARLEPRLEAIKKNHKGEAQAEKIMALYKEEGVSPLYSLKSLFGIAILIPIFIGAFDMLAENIHLSGVSFLWIQDLARPDDLFQLPFRLPFFGNEFNLLPFIMTGFSVLSSYLHQPPAMTDAMRRRQFRNLFLMALAFFILFYTFPAGMVLYWTINNLISVFRDLWLGRKAKT